MKNKINELTNKPGGLPVHIILENLNEIHHHNVHSVDPYVKKIERQYKSKSKEVYIAGSLYSKNGKKLDIVPITFDHIKRSFDIDDLPKLEE